MTRLATFNLLGWFIAVVLMAILWKVADQRDYWRGEAESLKAQAIAGAVK